MGTTETTTYPVDTYTAIAVPRLSSGLRIGDRVRLRGEDSADAREWDAFQRHMEAAGMRLDYLDTEADADGEEWDSYVLVPDEE
jgi:hypothetical protein